MMSCLCELSIADEIRVAVASNFSNAISSIAEQFERNTGHKVTLIIGSTGKHYAQIINGAPYHALFAADTARPLLIEKRFLEQNKSSLANTRFTYAIGKIILWSPEPDYIENSASVLNQGKFRFLAIANPKLAPYGLAAQEILKNLKLWNTFEKKMVRGENIAQTFQFVKSGNAKLGFVALSQVTQITQSKNTAGSYWEVPQSLYTPIEQQAILLKDNSTARSFMTFVQSDDGQAIISSYGYDIP